MFANRSPSLQIFGSSSKHAISGQTSWRKNGTELDLLRFPLGKEGLAPVAAMFCCCAEPPVAEVVGEVNLGHTVFVGTAPRYFKATFGEFSQAFLEF